MTELIEHVAIREYNDKTDRNFCLAPILQHFTYHSRRFFTYWTEEHKLDYVNTMYNTALHFFDGIVACDKNDPEILFAFLMASRTENHIFFNYTKYLYRQIGIQSQMLMPILIDKNSPITVNFTTPNSMKWKIKNQVKIVDKLFLNIMKGIEYEN